MNNRLRVLRAERGWSQQDLAERLEVSRQSVNAIETGKYDPSKSHPASLTPFTTRRVVWARSSHQTHSHGAVLAKEIFHEMHPHRHPRPCRPSAAAPCLLVKHAAANTISTGKNSRV